MLLPNNEQQPQIKTPPRIFAAGISHLSDARFFATFAEWLCLDLTALTLQQAREITNWVTGPQLTGFFDPQPETNLNDTAYALQLTGIAAQYTPNFELIDAHQITNFIRCVQLPPLCSPWQAQTIFEQAYNQSQYAHQQITTYILAQFDPANIETTCKDLIANAQKWQPIFNQYPVLLDLPKANSADIAQITAIFNIEGLVIWGENELITGIRTFDEVTNLLEVLGIE
ncbi:MAG TPA: hypothetical protein PKD56_03385 [Chitinophagales bacterium]|nr:hypothetical protein [Chitinophagales bacterium]